jgi:hypothetical protein
MHWLRHWLDIWSKDGGEVPDVVVLASPYCPFRHPDRLREAVDTLLIHQCDLVVGVDAEPIVPWVVGADGLRPLACVEALAKARAVRRAGELVAVHTRWLQEAGSLEDALIGYVELLHPEWWCIKDDVSWEAGQALLPHAAALQIPPSTFLRTEQGVVP